MSDATRKGFPILGSNGTRIDWQLVVDHGEQAYRNHGQSVAHLASRGGLCWSELYAVLHDKTFQKMGANDALIACRALEVRYLAAQLDLPPTLSAAMKLPEVRALVEASTQFAKASMSGSDLGWVLVNLEEALAPFTVAKP